MLKSLHSQGPQGVWREHFETSSRRSLCLWLQWCLSMCSAERAPSANGEPVSIFQPDWFTFHSTQRAFPCSVRSSGMSRSLELSFYWSRQCGPSYSAAAISNSYADLRPGQLLWGPPPKRDGMALGHQPSSRGRHASGSLPPECDNEVIRGQISKVAGRCDREPREHASTRLMRISLCVVTANSSSISARSKFETPNVATRFSASKPSTVSEIGILRGQCRS